MQNGLDKEKCANYIKNNSQYSDALQFIFDNTIYVTKQDILDNIRLLVEQWVKTILTDCKLGVLIDNSKIGSQQWLYLHYKDLLPPHTIIHPQNIPYISLIDMFNDKKRTIYNLQMKEWEKNKAIPEKYDRILIVDDISYSGAFILSLIDCLTYKTDNYKNTDFDIIVTYQSDYGLRKQLSDSKFPIKSANIISYKQLKVLQSELFTEEFLKKYQSATCEPVVAINLEYKLQNEMSTWSQIYSNCRDPPDRIFMKEVEQQWLKTNEKI